MPDDADFLCGGWIWDPAPRELRSHTRTRKGWKDEPEQVERLRAVASVTWHRWSQAPMQTATGDVIPASHSRVVVAYEGGGGLTSNEANRGRRRRGCRSPPTRVTRAGPTRRSGASSPGSWGGRWA